MEASITVIITDSRFHLGVCQSGLAFPVRFLSSLHWSTVPCEMHSTGPFLLWAGSMVPRLELVSLLEHLVGTGELGLFFVDGFPMNLSLSPFQHRLCSTWPRAQMEESD